MQEIVVLILTSTCVVPKIILDVIKIVFLGMVVLLGMVEILGMAVSLGMAASLGMAVPNMLIKALNFDAMKALEFGAVK